MSEFEIVDRPVQVFGRPRRDDFLEALQTTLESGKAIQVVLNGKRATSYRNRGNMSLRVRGQHAELRLRSQKIDAERMAFWLEKRS